MKLGAVKLTLLMLFFISILFSVAAWDVNKQSGLDGILLQNSGTHGYVAVSHEMDSLKEYFLKTI